MNIADNHVRQNFGLQNYNLGEVLESYRVTLKLNDEVAALKIAKYMR